MRTTWRQTADDRMGRYRLAGLIGRSSLHRAFLDGMRAVGWTETRDFEMAYPTPSCEVDRCSTKI
jgi:hypothetical protein